MDKTLSFLSQRAALFVLRQSVNDKWPNPVFGYAEPINFGGKFMLGGFQPKSGYHIAVKPNPSS